MIFIRRLIGAVALLVALFSAAGALAAQGGRVSDLLDVAAHFAPLWFMGGAVALALWALARREGGRPAMALAVTAIVASGALMAPDLLAAASFRPAPPGAETIKVIQLNTWGNNLDPRATARWILAQDADIVVVEEAYNTKSGVDRRLRPHFAGWVSCAEPDAGCSTLIFHKRPAIAQGGLAAGRQRPFLAASWVTLPGRGGPFTVVGAHYTWPWPAGPQQAQSRRLANTVARFPKATTIVAGDFNSTPWSHTLRRQDEALGLERRTRALLSWPTEAFERFGVTPPFPVLPIDHVYAGHAWRTVSVERGPRLGSDHYPVVVVLTRGEPAPSPAAR